MIFISLLLNTTWERENTLCNIWRLPCWGGACYKKICPFLCTIYSLWEKVPQKTQGLLSTYYVLLVCTTSSNLSLADMHISIFCNFPKNTALRCQTGSLALIPCSQVLFCLSFQPEMKDHVLCMYHPLFPVVFVMKHS